MAVLSKLKKKVRSYRQERKRKKREEAITRKLEKQAFEKAFRRGRIEAARQRGYGVGYKTGVTGKKRFGTVKSVGEWFMRRSEAASKNLAKFESEFKSKPFELDFGDKKSKRRKRR